MKKILLSLLLFLFLLLAAAIFLPYIFKDKIVETIKNEANKSLTAKLDFNNSISINIFRSFPDLSLGIKDITLQSKDSAYSDLNIVSIEKLQVSIDLLKFYRTGDFLVKKLSLEKPIINLEIDTSGKENWDIVVSEEEEEEETQFEMQFDQISVSSGSMTYNDRKALVFFQMNNLNHTSNGLYNADSMSLAAETESDQIFMDYDGIRYLNLQKVKQSGRISIDWVKELYSFRKHDFSLNGLPLFLDGSIDFEGDDMIFDIKANSSTSDLNNFLSLIPSIYTSDFESMKTKGSGKLAFDFKGTYSDLLFPAFKLDLQINDGWFKYPDLAMPAEDLGLDLKFETPDGVFDHLSLDIKKLHFKLGEDVFNAKLNLINMMRDPIVDAVADGRVNLGNLAKIMPLPEGTSMSGIIDLNAEIAGSQSAITAASINQFKANGSVKTEGLNYSTSEMPLPLAVSKATVIMKDQKLSIPVFEGNLGKNDIRFSAELDQFFAYLMLDKELRGNVQLNSSYFNANDFLVDDASTSNDTVELSVIEVPGDIDLNLNASFDKLIYDDLDISEFATSARVVNRSVIINDLYAQILGGKLQMQGSYNYDPIQPRAKFNINYTDIAIQNLASHFDFISAFVPIANQIKSNSSAILDFESDLNQDMSPTLRNLSLAANLNIDQVELQHFDVLKSIDQKLGTKMISMKEIKNLNLNFNIKDGQLLVKPFNLNLDSVIMSLDGLSKLDGSIDYQGLLTIPSSYVTSKSNPQINQLIGQSKLKDYAFNINDYVNLDVLIDGSFKKPEVKLNVKEVKQNIKSGIKQQLDQRQKQIEQETKDRIDKLKQDTEDKAAEKKKEIEAEIKKKEDEAKAKLEEEAQKQKDAAKKEAENKLKGIINKKKL